MNDSRVRALMTGLMDSLDFDDTGALRFGAAAIAKVLEEGSTLDDTARLELCGRLRDVADRFVEGSGGSSVCALQLCGLATKLLRVDAEHERSIDRRVDANRLLGTNPGTKLAAVEEPSPPGAFSALGLRAVANTWKPDTLAPESQTGKGRSRGST